VTEFSFDEGKRTRLPAIGLGWAVDVGPLAAREIARLKALNLAHLRVDAGPAAAQAAALGLPLEVALTGGRQPGELKAPRWLVFDKSKPAGPAGPIVRGTDANFAELNRDRPDVAGLDGACFPVNPQVHAFDNDSLVENLAAQYDVLESARQFLGRTPVYVTPVTLKPRPQADPRQASLFGAGWTAGSLKYLARGEPAAVTYYETAGPRGVMDVEGTVFPLYHVLADAGEFAGGEALVSESSEPLAADGIVMRKGGRTRILLANFRPEPREVRLGTAGLGRRVRVRHLDETTAERAMTSPEDYRSDPGQLIDLTGHWLEITLRPYAVVRIDGGLL
jgi:hypothetical protein